jgi:hypothetical protein
MTLIEAMKTKRPFRQLNKKHAMFYQWDGSRLWWWVDKETRKVMAVMTTSEIMAEYEVFGG